MSDNLKNCPFCGEKMEVWEDHHEGYGIIDYGVKCLNLDNCGFRSHGFDLRQEAINAANRRTP